jgi:TonB family protein
MSSTGTLPAGTVVADRYRIEEPLAGEGSAAAYRATDLRLERAVALRALAAADGGAAVQQGKAAARLVHPNVARVLDFGSDGALGVEFVVADLGTGGTLAALLAQRGAPPLPLALRIMQEAAAGMAAAHRAGLVHGDLHPGVLWLSRDEGRLHVQVLGLGLNPAGAPPARATARYASPERLRRGRELAPAADVFSLGVVAYEVFAGLPAEWMSLLLSMARGQAVIAPSLLDTRPELPAHVAQAVRRALLADPSQRWPEAGDFAAHLIAESAAAPAPAPAAAAPPPPVEAPITAASFAAHVAEAAAPADEVEVVADAVEVVADAVEAREPEPVVIIAVAEEPLPAAEPEIAASVDVPAPAAPPVVEAVVAPPAPVAAPPAPRQPARRGQPIAATKTDLADSLYIPPALEKAARPEPRTPVRAEAPAPAPAPAVEVSAPAPEPVLAKAEPVIAAPEPAVLQREADRTIATPIAEVVALVPHRPADVSVAVASPDAEGTALIPIPVRGRTSGMAKMGQPTGNRRALLAAGIVVAVLVSGGVIAKTVLAGSGARPEAQSLAAASLLPTAGGTAQPQQQAVDPSAPGAAPVDTSAAAVDPTLTPQEQARKLEEQKKLEEQRRLQQRQRDSLRQAQQLAAQQQQPAAPQVALAAPRPAASAPAPQIEQRAAVPAASEPAAAPPSAPATRTADANRVYGGGEVDQAPSLANGSSFRSAVNRTYPAVLRNSGQWGSAVVSFTVGADGRVERSSITVEQASHPSFRAAATSAIASARFNPARVNGQPVRASVSMPITWQGGEQRDED